MAPTKPDLGRALTLPAFYPMEHRTLRDHAYAQIRDALMSGRLEAGQQITIRSLAAALGISPTPVREAVRRLAAEGAVEAEPNRWIRVPRLSAADLRELRGIRLALEGLATERAVARITPDEIAQLRRLDAAIAERRGAGDVKGMIPLIQQYHFAVYGAARMPRLLQMIGSLWLRTGPHIMLLFHGYAQKERGQLRARTIRAIEARGPALARQTMEADIGHAVDYLIGLAEGSTAVESAARPIRRASGVSRKRDAS